MANVGSDKSPDPHRESVAADAISPRAPATIVDTPATLFAINADGVFTMIEGSLPQLHHTELQKFVHQSYADVLTSLGLDASIEAFDRAMAGEYVTISMDVRGNLLDVYLTPVYDDDGSLIQVLGTTHDISRRHGIERSLRRHNAFLEALHQTTLDLINRLEIDDLLQSIVERAAALLGTGHGYLYLVEPDERAITVRYGCGLFRDYLGFSMARGEGVAGKVWATGTKLVVDEYDAWDGRSGAWATDLIRAVACVPLLVGGRVVGVIGVSNPDSVKGFDDEEVRVLSQFAELASLALENARLYRSAQDEIAERKRTEAALRASEARYKSVVTAMGEGIIVVDADAVITDMNRTAERIIRVPREQLVGRSIHAFNNSLFKPDGSPFDMSTSPAAITLETGMPQDDVLLVVHHEDGTETWISVNSQPIPATDGQPAAVVVSFSNITEHKRVQAALQRRIDMLAALQQIDVKLNQSLDVNVVLQTALSVTTSACHADHGFIFLLHDGHPHSLRVLGSDLSDVEAMLEAWQDSGVWDRLLAARQPVELEGDNAMIVVPLALKDSLAGLLALRCGDFDGESDTLGFFELVGARIATALDNARLFQDSQKHLAEIQDVYSQLQRLEQLKTQMIRVAAHDLRSPLGVISGYVSILQADLGAAGKPYDDFFDAIFRAIARMEQMTTDILSLERIHATQEANYELLSLTELVTRAYADHEHIAQNAGLRIELVPEESPLDVCGEPVQLYEAVANLISNAIKYTPQDGQITIRLSQHEANARVEISDTGLGVPDDAKEQLFQPFYRVKTEETRMIDGTGLGLYLVKSIIERHKGTMVFESELGRGSTFGFELPLAPASPSSTAQS